MDQVVLTDLERSTNDVTYSVHMLRLGETQDGDSMNDPEDILMSLPYNSERNFAHAVPHLIHDSLPRSEPSVSLDFPCVISLLSQQKGRIFSPISILPSELLCMIFEYALPPPFFLSLSLVLGPTSAWCQAIGMKRSLICVSKRWWKAGIHLLYEDVVIRRLSQLRVFRETLDRNSFGVRQMVKKLAVTCIVLNPDEDEECFYSDLSKILHLCSDLRSLCYDPHETMDNPFIAAERWAFIPSHLSDNITYLDFGNCVDSASILTCLKERSQRLEYLSFCPPRGSVAQDVLFSNISLPSLEVLSCTVSEECLPALWEMAQCWHLPRLRALTFHIFRRYHADLLPALEDFIRRQGQRLKYLHLMDRPTHTVYAPLEPPNYVWHITGRGRNRPERSPTVVRLQDLIKHCPALEHLVIPVPTAALELGIPLSHPTVKWIDAWWDRWPCWPTLERSKTLAQHRIKALSHLPALRRIRCLDKTLLNNIHRDIPFLLPPYDLIPGDRLNYIFPGVHIVHSWEEIYRPDMENIEEHGDFVMEMADYVSSDEEEVLYGSGSDDSDSDTETSYSSLSESDFPEPDGNANLAPQEAV